LKPARLRPQARLDRLAEVRYYRQEAGSAIAERLVRASAQALDQIEQQPGMGSPTLGKSLDMEGLRTWRIKGFPLIWFYFERADHLDVVRLLGERQDAVALLMQSS
jgi:toxin ParE1/3/4